MSSNVDSYLKNKSGGGSFWPDKHKAGAAGGRSLSTGSD